jgi:hypothetical protein
VWDTGTNVILAVNLFYIPYTLAFDTDDILVGTRLMEFSFDVIFTINIVLNFFTAFQQDIEWKYNLKDIAKSYIKSFFVMDLLATIPGLVTFEDPDYYWVKAIRYIRFFGLLKHINDILQKIFNKMGLNKQLIERIFYFFKLILNLIFIIHILACTWCYIGRGEVDTWVGTRGNCDYGDEDATLPFDNDNIWNLYIVAVYWVITTLTTVGYGDFKGCTNNEYLF